MYTGVYIVYYLAGVDYSKMRRDTNEVQNQGKNILKTTTND